MGWQDAWREADRLSAMRDDDEDDDDKPLLSTDPNELPLSEEAGADFDRRLVHGSPSRPQPSTTLKAPPILPTPASPSTDYASNSLPKHTLSGINTEAAERRSCISEGNISISSGEEVEGEAYNILPLVGTRVSDECAEARRAVIAQHQAVTLRRINRMPIGAGGSPLHAFHNQYHQHQASTLAVPTVSKEESLSSSVQHSGSLNDLPLIEDNFGELMEDAQFEQVSWLVHHFNRHFEVT